MERSGWNGGEGVQSDGISEKETFEVVHVVCRCTKYIQYVCTGKVSAYTHNECLIGDSDESNEHAEHHIDEEGNEYIEVDLAEDQQWEGQL